MTNAIMIKGQSNVKPQYRTNNAVGFRFSSVFFSLYINDLICQWISNLRITEISVNYSFRTKCCKYSFDHIICLQKSPHINNITRHINLCCRGTFPSNWFSVHVFSVISSYWKLSSESSLFIRLFIKFASRSHKESTQKSGVDK